jgi:hypothetical protein
MTISRPAVLSKDGAGRIAATFAPGFGYCCKAFCIFFSARRDISQIDLRQNAKGITTVRKRYGILRDLCPLDWRIERLTAVRVSGRGALRFSSQSTTVCAACTPIPAMSQRTEDSDG